jgi:hypothetical protein
MGVPRLCLGRWRKFDVFGVVPVVQKVSRIEDGHLMSDHVPMMISVPPINFPRLT